MVCSQQGKPPAHREDGEDARRRHGAASMHTNCRMEFRILAEDYSKPSLQGEWRVK